MPDRQAVSDVLRPLVQQHSIRAAVVTTCDGEVLAAEAWPGGIGPAGGTAEWASDQAKLAASYRRHLHQKEFSVMFDPATDETRLHIHVEQIGDHLLALLFSDRYYLGDIRRLSRSAAHDLELLLRSNS